MAKYIFTQRDGIHIIDLEKTLELLNRAREFIKDVAASGKDILFVGTKKQAQEAVEEEAKRCGALYVVRRWLGGTLTNFQVIKRRLDYFAYLQDRKEKGEFEKLPKKEAIKLERELERLEKLFGGIKNMMELPGALFVIDPVNERIAVKEARIMEIPVVAVVDTDCNPDEIDYPIPANDDAIKSIKLLCSVISDAVIEGKRLYEERPSEPVEEEHESSD
mgnify:CR=1 FL=1